LKPRRALLVLRKALLGPRRILLGPGRTALQPRRTLPGLDELFRDPGELLCAREELCFIGCEGTLAKPEETYQPNCAVSASAVQAAQHSSGDEAFTQAYAFCVHEVPGSTVKLHSALSRDDKNRSCATTGEAKQSADTDRMLHG